MESAKPATGEVTRSQVPAAPLPALTTRERLCIYLLIGLSLQLLAVAFKIEWLNANSGHYLTRPDRDLLTLWHNAFGGDINGTPIADLRLFIKRFGFFQFIVAPCLLSLAVYSYAFLRPRSWHMLSITAGLIATLSFALAVYRGYLTILN